jgi:hypothetical protein
MLQITVLLIHWLAASLVPIVLAAPADVLKRASPGPPGAVGSLRGSEALLGPGGEPVNQASSAIVSNYNEVPGQKASANTGLYLDFTKTQNPQPIRESLGGTDPGPST